jgi:hypothetical protein
MEGGPPKSPQSWGDFEAVALVEMGGKREVDPLNPPLVGDFNAVTVEGWLAIM